MRTRVSDVMTSRVQTVVPTDSFKTIVERLRTGAISAVPVVDKTGRVLGVVSEADLLLKEDREMLEGGHHFLEGARAREARAKAGAATAADLMTTPAITIRASAPVVLAARLMRTRNVKRLPVVDELDRLVGIVSRGDLLAVFTRSDWSIRREIFEDVIQHMLLLDPRPFTVAVEDGIVTLTGEADRRTDAILVERLARRVDGVVDVRSSLTFRLDDGPLPAPPAAAQHPYEPLVKALSTPPQRMNS